MKKGLILAIAIAVLMVTTATATAQTVTITSPTEGQTFLIGENITVSVASTGYGTGYNLTVKVLKNNNVVDVLCNNKTMTTSTMTLYWDTSKKTYVAGKYTILAKLYNKGVLVDKDDVNVTLTPCYINYVKIENVTMSGTVHAYDKAKVEVNITTKLVNQNPSVTLIIPNYPVSGKITKVSLTGSVNATTHYGEYTGTVNISKATYGYVPFYVNVSYGTIGYVNNSYYSIDIEPNVTKKWIVLEANTPKPSGWPSSMDCAILTFGKNVINATIYVAVADEYGNVNNSIPANVKYVANVYKVSGPTVNINRTTVTIDNNHPYQAVNVSVLASDAPCTVVVGVSNGAGTSMALESTTKSIYYTTGVAYLDVKVEKDKLFANNTDSTKVYVYLKDKNGNTLKLSGYTINIGEKTALGLKFNPTSALTNASGVAVFTVTAGVKSGVATIVATTADGSAYGTANITLLQAVNKGYSKFEKATYTMTAGKPVKIVYELRDYDNKPIVGAKVKLNISSGDGWFELNGKKVESPVVLTTDSKGNATIYVNSTNATNNNIVIEAYFINESGKWEKDETCTITVIPAPVHRIAIYYDNNEVNAYAFPEGYNKQVTFTIKYLDVFGNVNASSGTVKIIPKSGVVGYFSTDTVAMSNGVGTVTFTPNASAKVGQYTVFTFNDSTFKTGNVTLKIVVSGIEAIKVTFSKPGYYVNQSVTAYAQLYGLYGSKLAKSGVVVTFTIKGPDYFKTMTSTTNSSGIATVTFKPKKPGVYTVTAVNGSIYGINKTVVAGNQTKIVIEPKEVTVPVNTTVEFKIAAYDINGYPSSVPYGKVNITVLKDGIVPVNTSTISLTAGKAIWSYNFTEVGSYTVVAQLNATLFDTASVTVTPPKFANITVVSVDVPEKVNVNETVEIGITVHNYGTAMGNYITTVTIVKPDNTTQSFNVTFVNVEPGKDAVKTVTYTPSIAGNYTVKVDGITKTFTAVKVVEVWKKYDKNGDNKISDQELINAITDWLNGKLSDMDLIKIIQIWLSS